MDNMINEVELVGKVVDFDCNPPTTEIKDKPTKKPRKDKAKSDEHKTSQDNQLKERLFKMVLVANAELFCDRSGKTFIKLLIRGHYENWAVESKDFRRFIRKLWRDTTGFSVSTSVIDEVIKNLDAEAAASSNIRQTFIRVAHHDGNIFIDLGDENWNAICVSKTGWQVIKNPPVIFLRPAGMLPLPIPIKGRSINQLRPLLNLHPDDERSWTLVIAWLLATFSPGPYPILVLLGEQGTAKSSFIKVLRRLVDPSEIPFSKAPREDRDVMVAATNTYLTAFDNLSSIPVWLSDLLCMISTGAASRERAMYTNDGEALFKAKRPIILDGIALTLRGDLADRSIIIELATIDPANRKPEGEFTKAIEELVPGIFGAILSILVSILIRLPDTKISHLPRMADFAIWATAAEKALGWKEGRFIAAFSENTANAAKTVLESDEFGSRLCDLMMKYKEVTTTWDKLNPLLLQDGEKVPPYWPMSAKALSNTLLRLAPALRSVGIFYDYKHSSHERAIAFWNKSRGGLPSEKTATATKMVICDA
jgi:hypothetical protein